MGYPYFTVITVCRNSEKTIEKTILSILKQTFNDYEYYVIDGVSTDKTLDVVDRYKESFQGKLHVISEPDGGIYDAMNKGIQHAKGRYISLLNSDDWYNADTLENVYQLTKDKNDYYAVIGDIQRFDQKERPIYSYHFDSSRIKKKIAFGHPAMFISNSVYKETGFYDLRYDLAADIDFQYRLYENKNIEWYICPKIFTNMRAGGATDNSKYLKKWIDQYTEIDCKYKHVNKKFQKIKITIGFCVRAIKNKMPFFVQKALYNIYRK